jgi:hypothetical protein
MPASPLISIKTARAAIWIPSNPMEDMKHAWQDSSCGRRDDYCRVDRRRRFGGSAAPGAYLDNIRGRP